MGAKRKTGSTKNPPIFSHEFIIQNHADIVSCIAMVIVVGLMFQVSTPFATLFVTMQHNLTVNTSEENKEPEQLTLYTYGMKDLCSIFFYFLITIVLHAVVQEYLLDKLNRKLHLSKSKHSKFNESGQLLVFYLISIVWGMDTMIKEGFTQNLSFMWEGYPHATLSFTLKFYFVIQIAYWLHTFPEIYFQKVKKEEMSARLRYQLLYSIVIIAGFLLNLTHLTLVCLIIHYFIEMIFHFARLMYFSDKPDLSDPSFIVWAVLFIIARLVTVTLNILAVGFGLGKATNQEINTEAGNFNVLPIRISVLTAVCLLEAWMLWNFLTFQLRRYRENQAFTAKKKFVPKVKDKKAKKEPVKNVLAEQQNDSSANEASPKAVNGGVRTRSKIKKK
ncbi:translocating chain-associated membrane protein 1-like isoform X3 [Anneissia japonica]|uniref:translocating chain-associated membrane protein 1-like isoform X3 n=1 Tax=Anneissia japonica TaxID=1529436 RepID=UPI001425920E|nr:translocating chain-associated membrane protein 1-like isoform X3 [Anneissia japonica]